MNKLVLKEMSGDKVVYRYFPNDGTHFGEIEYLFSSMEAVVLSKASGDETGYFAENALTKIKKVIKDEKALPLDFVQAFY
jgi:hypothetical protein